ncbi:UNVERIFIED_CONTAM: hypothetical protein Scaly_2121300 [Sesamum calycinum]|uniref:Leucine-rich repeat-containing N-terminal plant-type domain-containing protein n=1 Tax=Sesamum calycinum TaxID=2727403 RepID=A0AAW2MNS3_9LAMI
MGSRGVLGSVVSSLTPFLILHSLFFQVNANTNSRQNLEIIIGGGAYPPSPPPDYGDCPDCSPPPSEPPVCPEPIPPPPPEPECPPPPPPPPPPRLPPVHHPPPPPRLPPVPINPQPPLPLELQRAVKVIERFRRTITEDPFNITKTWNGRICKDKHAYRGFLCDTTISDNKTRVALVKFNGFRFKGKPLKLANFLDGLKDLIVFHANTNFFTGQVPSGISKIPSLFEFDLSNNRLSGGFPRAVLAAINLTFLDLRFNQLTGELPPEVFTLDLDVLYLNNNQFDGNIPENLGKTPVRYLTFANNKFTGRIPKSIGQTSNTLLEVLFQNNQLSGCLPPEIGSLKNATVFDASANRLTGPIPHSFGCLKNMLFLNMSYNQLYGAVPEPLCNIGSLVELTLKFNYFTQVGPKCRKLIMSKKLDISMNCILDLPSQRSPAECEAFFLNQQSWPDPQSLVNYVPCEIDNHKSPEESAEERKLMAQPRSYAALQNHQP